MASDDQRERDKILMENHDLSESTLYGKITTSQSRHYGKITTSRKTLVHDCCKFRSVGRLQCVTAVLADMKEGFTMLAKDEGGLPVQEIGTVLRAINQNPTESDVKQMINDAEVDGK